MRIRFGALATLALAAAACGDGDTPYGPGGDGGGSGGGPVGTVQIGTGIRFMSQHNGTANPAVDTIPAGTAVTWTWTGNLPHSVRSVGTPSFTSSDVRTGSGTYSVTFTTPGTYRYQCSVHGTAMTGTIVVMPANGNGQVSQTVTDATGDTFGTGPNPWDITAFTIDRAPDAVTARLEFSRDVLSPAAGNADGVIALVDLDLDQNAATGVTAIVDEYRQDGGSTGLGVDALVPLGVIAPDGTVPVLDAAGSELGRVTPVFAGRTITVRIPTSVLRADDGYVNAAAIVGVVGQPTDFVPNAGHLALSAPGAGLVAHPDGRGPMTSPVSTRPRR